MRNWLRNDFTKQVDEITDSEKFDVDGVDPESDPRVATHITNVILAAHITNKISTQKLLIDPTIQVVVGPITSLVTAGVVGARESFSPRQTVHLQANVTEAACSCARIYRTPGKLSGTERDFATPSLPNMFATPRDASSSETNSRLRLQRPSFIVTFVSPEHFRGQDIVIPRHPTLT